ncbi:MAG TPA: hypothetical protein EYP77_10800 [Anaerolineae bacterium]|nr:hypothetical protein [Anaerolineae bacterium]
MRGELETFRPRIGRLSLAVVAALVVFGATTAVLHAATLVVDLAERPPYGTLLGVEDGGRAGTAVAVGDLDGDGLADLVVGAPGESPTGVLTQAGRVYVFFGRGALSGTVSLATADLVIEGDRPWAGAGRALTVGDLNDDLVDDLVIGAPFARITTEVGMVYVVYGGGAFSPSLSLSQADVVISGTEPGAWAGSALAVGDLSGDGVDDLAIGAPGADSGALGYAGRVYVLHGGALPGALSLAAADAVIEGRSEYAFCGNSLAIADLSGDHSYMDLAVGASFKAPLASPQRGEAYVFFGGPGLAGTLSADDADVRVNGDWLGDGLGRALVAGDVSGDGIADLAIGASGDESGGLERTSSTYLFYGGSGLAGVYQASDDADVVLRSGVPGEQSGYALTMGNLDGDDLADLVIGAWLADVEGRIGGGRSYVLYGSRLTTTQSIYDDADVIVEAPVERGRMGSALACGPLFGAGYDDLIVGAPTTGDEAGAVYLLEMPPRGVRIGPDYDVEIEEVGTHVVYTHVLTNLCVITDSFHLTYTVQEGTGWGHSIEPVMVTVPGWATATVYFHVTAPLNLGQVVDVSLVWAASSADPSATDAATDRSEAGGRKMYLPLVLRRYR